MTAVEEEDSRQEMSIEKYQLKVSDVYTKEAGDLAWEVSIVSLRYAYGRADTQYGKLGRRFSAVSRCEQ